MNTIADIIAKLRQLLNAADLKFHSIFAAFAASFCAASFFAVFKRDFTKDSFFDSVSIPLFLFVTLFGTLIITVGCIILKTPAPAVWSLLFASFLLAVQFVVSVKSNIYFNIGIAIVLFLVAKYVCGGDRLLIAGIRLSWKSAYIIVCAMFVVFTVLCAYFTSLEYFLYRNSTYDFGIFAQMFEQMAKTGLPNTTVERDGLVSHFAVHFSPIFYLLLPGYMIFRTPFYLLSAQAFCVGLGAFPVFRIAKKLGFSEKLSVACAALYLLYPTMSNGCFYDFHENKLLSVVILYLIYFLLEKKTVPTLIFTLLTLMVKEDAAIYVGAVALWYIVSQRKKWLGALTLAIACVYFAAALSLIGLFGGEPMMSRLNDYYISGEENFLAVIKTCFFNIGYLISKVFVEEKLQFILWMLVPVLFAPFLTKKSSLLLLLTPMLVINLMPSWKYQYDVDYQYTYGVAALIVFASVILISELSPEKRRTAICFMLSASAVFMLSLTAGKADSYSKELDNNRDVIKATNEAIRLIPEGASVSASTQLAPHLYYIDDLQSFPEYYGELTHTEYCILDTRWKDKDEFNGDGIIDDTYYLFSSGGYAEIWRKSEYAPSGGIE